MISLAGLLDLNYAKQHHLSNDAVLELLNGTPLDTIASSVSPIDMLPLSSDNIYLLHGNADNNVPIAISNNYAEKETRLNMTPHYKIIQGAGHFDLVNPESDYFSAVENTVKQAFFS